MAALLSVEASLQKNWIITFRVSRRQREIVQWSRASVCLSAAASPHYCTDSDVTLGSGSGGDAPSYALLSGSPIGARVVMAT